MLFELAVLAVANQAINDSLKKGKKKDSCQHNHSSRCNYVKESAEKYHYELEKLKREANKEMSRIVADLAYDDYKKKKKHFS